MDFAQLTDGFVVAGRYRIERRLKAGGMGAVYVALHLKTTRRVALKVMHPEIVADASMRRRFTQEAQVASLVKSRHVVDVIDADVDDSAGGLPFLVMELLEGIELGDLVRQRGAIPTEEALGYLAQTARGLDRAHAAGVVHRDLKPENLFVCKDEDGAPLVKILDFGIAKITQGVTQRASMVGGTPLYMAPEQSGDTPITSATDVWAFGLIAYTLLVGKPYWEEDTIQRLYAAVLRETHPPAVERARSHGVVLPREFDSGFFFRCVARDPRTRFATAGEAMVALRRVMRGPGSEVALALAATQPGKDPIELAKTEAASGDAEPRASPSRSRKIGSPVRWGVLGLGSLVVAAATIGAWRAGWFSRNGRDDHGARALTSTDVSDANFASSKNGVLQIAAGGAHACALFGEGRVSCWGADASGQLGDAKTADRFFPEPVLDLRDATQIALGADHSCARRSNGTVACWGANESGQLGDGTKANRSEPTVVPGLTDAVGVALGKGHTCVVRGTERTVACWGDGTYGQLGDGLSAETDPAPYASHYFRPILVPTAVLGLRDVAELALGRYHTCARRTDGTVACWGANAFGQLGDGTNEPHLEPRWLGGLRDVAQIAAGAFHTCVRRTDGSVACWGSNEFGELGIGDVHRNEPTTVPDLRDVVEISAGDAHTCARHADGTVSCWGADAWGVFRRAAEPGALDDVDAWPGYRDYFCLDEHPDPSCPVGVVPALRDVTRLAVGGSFDHTGRKTKSMSASERGGEFPLEFACALRANGAVVCWGFNKHGELGNASSETCNAFHPTGDPVVTAPCSMHVDGSGFHELLAVSL